MDLEQYWLGKLAEECNEVAHAALKAQQFGGYECMPDPPHTSNFDHLKIELDDLATIIQILNDHFDLDYMPDQRRINEKRIKAIKFLEKSERLGKVAD